MHFDTMQMLEIIASAVQDHSMLVEEAKEAPNLTTLVDGPLSVQKAIDKAVLSVEKALKTLSPGQRAALLKLSAIMPGYFDKATLYKLLGIQGALGYLTACPCRPIPSTTLPMSLFPPSHFSPLTLLCQVVDSL